jgi:hypothetical protein
MLPPGVYWWGPVRRTREARARTHLHDRYLYLTDLLELPGVWALLNPRRYVATRDGPRLTFPLVAAPQAISLRTMAACFLQRAPLKRRPPKGLGLERASCSTTTVILAPTELGSTRGRLLGSRIQLPTPRGVTQALLRKQWNLGLWLVSGFSSGDTTLLSAYGSPTRSAGCLSN